MTQPVEKFKEGNINVSIWENQGPRGLFRSATVQLRYKDAKSGEWKDGSSYGIADLENLEKAAHEARQRLIALKKGGNTPEAA